MAIKFEKIQAGMTLWSRGSYRDGIGRSRKAEWPVYIRDVYPDTRSADVSWNGNAPTIWGEYRLTRLYATRMKTKGNP